jgi:hypothetical protein
MKRDNPVVAELARLTERLARIEERLEMNQDPWLDTAEVCKLLHVTKRTLANYRVKGILPFKKIGGKIYYQFDGRDMSTRSLTLIKPKKS